MRIICATWLMAEYQGRILTEEGAEDRLVSYYEIKDKPDWVLSEYVEQGKIDKPKGKRRA